MDLGLDIEQIQTYNNSDCQSILIPLNLIPILSHWHCSGVFVGNFEHIIKGSGTSFLYDF